MTDPTLYQTTAPNEYVIITAAEVNYSEATNYEYGVLVAIDGVKINCRPRFARQAIFMLKDIAESTGRRGKVLAGLDEETHVWTICES